MLRPAHLPALLLVAAAAAAAAALTAAPEERDLVGLDLPDLAVHTLFVRVLTAAQRALDVHRAALRQVLPAELRRLAPDADLVPLGALLPLTFLVGPLLRRRDAQVGDRLAALRIAHLGVSAQVANEDHLIDRSHAFDLLLCRRTLPLTHPKRQPRRLCFSFGRSGRLSHLFFSILRDP